MKDPSHLDQIRWLRRTLVKAAAHGRWRWAARGSATGIAHQDHLEFERPGTVCDEVCLGRKLGISRTNLGCPCGGLCGGGAVVPDEVARRVWGKYGEPKQLENCTGALGTRFSRFLTISPCSGVCSSRWGASGGVDRRQRLAARVSELR